MANLMPEEPAAEAGTGAPSETQCQAAVPAEAPDAPLNGSPGVLSSDRAPQDEAAVVVETEARGAEIRAAGQPGGEPQTEAPAAGPEAAASEPAVAAEYPAAPSPDEERRDAAPSQMPGPAAKAPPPKRGLFGRLFGGAAAKWLTRVLGL